MGKCQTETLPYGPSNSEVNIARPTLILRFSIKKEHWRLKSSFIIIWYLLYFCSPVISPWALGRI